MTTSTISREPVLELAKQHMSSGRCKSAEGATALALRELLHLSDRDGIWGGSDAAIALGYRGHLDTEDLLDVITADLASNLSPARPQWRAMPR